MAFVKRKKIRLEGYDYSSCGAYFITICVADRNRLLWQNAEADYDRKRAEAYSHEPPLLSGAGTIVKNEIQKLSTIYGNVMVDQYCIMPDHIHLILLILPDEKGQAHPAPTVSRIIKQFKGSVTKQIGNSIWQKSFYDKLFAMKGIIRRYGNTSMRIRSNESLMTDENAGERSSPLQG